MGQTLWDPAIKTAWESLGYWQVPPSFLWNKYPDERPTIQRNLMYFVWTQEKVYLAMYRHDVKKFFDYYTLDFLDGIDAPVAKYWMEVPEPPKEEMEAG